MTVTVNAETWESRRRITTSDADVKLMVGDRYGGPDEAGNDLMVNQAINLGSGLYLDVEGNVTQTAPGHDHGGWSGGNCGRLHGAGPGQ